MCKKLLFLAVLLVFVGSACGDITTGLVGHWKMDDGVGVTVADSSGYGNDGTMGNDDDWISGGGIDFYGSGDSGISFANNGADLLADMDLTDAVTVSYIATWASDYAHVNYPYDGRDVNDLRLLSSECPTGVHILTHCGADNMWSWAAFDDQDDRFIFGKVEKTWGDDIRITLTADYNTGVYKLYVDDYLYASATSKTGSFENVVKFTIGRTTSGTSEKEGKMEDFRIYDRALLAADVAQLVAERAATKLIPGDGEVAAATADGDVTLYWVPGSEAADVDGHDVYFGDTEAAVSTATTASDEYQGRQTAESFDVASLSDLNTYYWRIDEVNGVDVWAGDVQSFTISDVWLMDFVSIGNLDTDDRICAYTIQGLMNQKGARVFFLHDKHNAGNSTADDYWVTYLENNKGFTFADVGNLRELVAAARNEGVVSGVTKYNPANIDTGEVTIAVNLAVDSNYVPVTAAMQNYTSNGLADKGYIDCFDGLTINDISGDWGTKLLAQSYGVNNLMPGKRTDGVFSCIRSFATFNDVHNYDNGIDYGVQQKFYAYDMNYDNGGTERDLLLDVMDHLDAPGMSYGSWHDEGIDLVPISATGNYTVLCGLNMSFWANVDYNSANLDMSREDSNMVLDDSKYYVMFQSSEGDTAAYLSGLQMSGEWLGDHGAWLKPNRSKGKVTWCTLPVAYDLWPALIEYYNTTTEPNDSFWTGPSGAGYNRVSSLPNLADWAAFTDSYIADIGIQGVECWWGFSLDMYETFKANAPHVKCFSHQGVNGGSNDWLSDGTPVVRAHATSPMSNGLWYAQLADPNGIVTTITNFAATKNTPYFITVYDVPNSIVDYAAIC
ncbi:MAG: hypothetical protein KAS96_05480, partial [Planctomycetes bacterium]|nr:hypothetical protein [Planctomycetota bacterium]